jgi:hypothetical protein
MQVTFKLSRADAASAEKYIRSRALKGSKWRIINAFCGPLACAFFGAGFAAVFIVAQKSSSFNAMRLYVALAFWALGLVIAIWVVSHVDKITKDFAYFDDGMFFSPQTVTVGNDALCQRIKNTDSKIGWADIYAIEKDTERIYIFIDSGVAFIIPRRAFADDTAFNEYYLEAHRRVSA